MVHQEKIGQKFSEANSSDVILGRGKISLDHVGNKRFKMIVALHSGDYERAGGKLAKTLISIKIVDIIYNSTPPGRFLQICPDTKQFYEVSRERARERVSQYLREAVNPPKPRPRAKSEKKPKKKTRPPPSKEKIVPDEKVVEHLIIMQDKFYRKLIHQLNDVGSTEEDNSSQSKNSDG